MEDSRITRTRQSLTEALLRLLSNSSLETISVAALCQEAGVHRTTFYGHARSIEEFAVDVLTRDVNATAAVEIAGGDPISPYRRAMIALLQHVAQERVLYRTLLASPWGGALRFAIDESLRDRVRLALDVFAAHGTPVPPHREEIVAFVTGALVGTLVLWAESDDDDAVAWAGRVQDLMPPWWPVHGTDTGD